MIRNLNLCVQDFDDVCNLRINANGFAEGFARCNCSWVSFVSALPEFVDERSKLGLLCIPNAGICIELDDMVLWRSIIVVDIILGISEDKLNDRNGSVFCENDIDIDDSPSMFGG